MTPFWFNVAVAAGVLVAVAAAVVGVIDAVVVAVAVASAAAAVSDVVVAADASGGEVEFSDILGYICEIPSNPILLRRDFVWHAMT